MRIFSVLAPLLFLACTKINAQTAAQQGEHLLTDEEQASLINLGVVGTSNVIFSEGRSAGELISCSIVFTATFQDFAYNEGRLHVANGNFTVFGQGELPLISMKLGVSELTKELPNFEPPEFAYFESSFGSSAKMNQVNDETDPGYKVFVYTPDDPLFPDMFDSLLSSRSIKISFNRNEGGLDQSVALETDVVSIGIQPESSQFFRTRSETTLNQFSTCSHSLLTTMMQRNTP
jgi:hypothetical protein